MDPVSRLEQRVERALADLDAMLSQARKGYALIGATAILLHGIALPRTTRDLDLVVAVEHDLDEIRPLLEVHGLGRTAIHHRFATKDGLEVDILPMVPGGTRVELPGGEFISRVGLSEAMDASVRVAFSTGEASLAPLSVLAAIKLYIATIRLDGHDLDDAVAVLEQYEAAGVRRFDVDYPEEEALSWETAGAWLAGRDARSVLHPESHAAVLAAAEQLLGDIRLSDRFAGGPESRALLTAFRAGLARAS
jgi:predicted nucleotidyltransferase